MEQRKFVYPYRIPPELYHHGILGQKWGKRNGPPYPLGSGDHSASEKKAGWRKSLDKGGSETSKKPEQKFFNRSAARRPNTKETPKSESKEKPSDDSKKESSRKSGMNPFANMDEAERQRMIRIARNVAIGTVVVGAILGGAYLKSRLDEKTLQIGRDYAKKAIDLEMELTERGHGGFSEWSRSDEFVKRASYKLSNTPLSELSDDDKIIKRGMEFQRIIKANSVNEGIAQEKVKDIMYAAYDDIDKKLYYHQFGVAKAKTEQKHGETAKRMAMQMESVKDIRLPSDRKRVKTFVDLLSDDTFRKAFEEDVGKNLKNTLGKSELDYSSPEKMQSYYKSFQHFLGNVDSKSRQIYVDKITQMGYNAIYDDNDMNAFGRLPVILLNAQQDVVIKGAQVVSEQLDRLNILNLGDVHSIFND